MERACQWREQCESHGRRPGLTVLTRLWLRAQLNPASAESFLGSPPARGQCPLSPPPPGPRLEAVTLLRGGHPRDDGDRNARITSYLLISQQKHTKNPLSQNVPGENSPAFLVVETKGKLASGGRCLFSVSGPVLLQNGGFNMGYGFENTAQRQPGIVGLRAKVRTNIREESRVSPVC